MKFHHSMGCGCDTCETDHGPRAFTTNITHATLENQNFRTAYWTGHHMQMTLMNIPPCGEIGAEMHTDTDQFIRAEAGTAIIRMGTCKERLDSQHQLHSGDAIFIPCGTWHNVINSGNCPLKLSSIYSPPQHPRGTIHRTKEAAESKEH